MGEDIKRGIEYEIRIDLHSRVEYIFKETKPLPVLVLLYAAGLVATRYNPSLGATFNQTLRPAALLTPPSSPPFQVPRLKHEIQGRLSG
jgi:hypothetical protein